jgi:hypothetical protein
MAVKFYIRKNDGTRIWCEYDAQANCTHLRFEDPHDRNFSSLLEALKEIVNSLKNKL